MNIQDILRKIAENKELTAEEKEFAAAFKPDNAEDSRIPKSRLDAEIAKRKEADQKAAEMKTKLDELQSKVEELESSGMSEAEKIKKDTEKELNKLKNQVAVLTKERDEAQAAISARDFSDEVRKLADKSKFGDPEYLEHLIRRNSIDLKDESAVSQFVKELETSHPGHFKSDAQPGSGSSPNKDAADVRSASAKRIEELSSKVNPSMRELEELVKLSETQNQENQAGQNPPGQ